MILYDIHTHQVKQSEGDYEVRSILSTSPSDSILNFDLQDVWFSCGIHPWDTSDSEEDFQLLADSLTKEKLIAIGEIGLDKLKGQAMDVQIAVFRRQIELADQVNKPIIVHCVKAWDELISLFKEYKTSVPWIIHGFRGNVEQTKQLVRLGFKFSIGDKFNAEAIKHIPLQSIFCETDMSSVSILNVYMNVSSVLGCSISQFVRFVGLNIEKYFNEVSK